MIIDVLICNPDGTQELVSREVELPAPPTEAAGAAVGEAAAADTAE